MSFFEDLFSRKNNPDDFRFIDERGRYCRFRRDGEEEYFVEGGRDSGVGNWYIKGDPHKNLPHRDKDGNWTNLSGEK